TGVARQVSRGLQVNLAVGEQRVDVVGAGFHFRHPGPAGDDDVLRVVLVGEQAHRARFDAQRNVLADQRDSLALGGKVGGTAQDARVVGVGAEPGRQHAGVAVVELDVQRAALCPARNGLNQPRSGWWRLASSSLITTSGTTTSCSAKREQAHGSDNNTDVSSTYVRGVSCGTAGE